MARMNAEEKYQAKQSRRRGLQKTKFYCQVCERQCMDENGFKCHIQSEVHMRNLKEKLTSSGGSRNLIDDYSERFVKSFVSLLKRSHGEKLIGANRFYQEYISDKEHVHLNSTKWKVLTKAVLHLHAEGLIRLVESGGANDEQFHIAYLDNSPDAIKRRKKEEKMKNLELMPESKTLLASALDESLQQQIIEGEKLMELTKSQPALKIKKSKLSIGNKKRVKPKPKTAVTKQSNVFGV
ncbi:Rts2 protein [Martiniozyma asiatica (nom. inval.)]|nr:Rts2 protein [Martiniozyma asiatica]